METVKELLQKIDELELKASNISLDFKLTDDKFIYQRSIDTLEQLKNIIHTIDKTYYKKATKVLNDVEININHLLEAQWVKI